MFEAYSVAVRIKLINGVSAGLMAMSSQFAKTHGDAKALQSQLDKIKLTMLQGGALVAAGAFGFAIIDKTVKPAKEYAHQLQQMNIAGMKGLEIAKATRAAWDAAKIVPTSSATENLAAIRELRMVFGDTGHAIENMPVVQQLQAVLANTSGVGNAHDEAYTVAKALEMKGAVRTPGEFMTQADMMAKAIVASGGKVGANDFLSAFKYGRSATIGWSDAFTYTILPTLIQEMKTRGGSGGGAGGPGNALMSAYAAVVGGAIPQKSLQVWSRLGLLDSSKVVYDKVGSAKGVGPGGIVGSELFQANPYEWAQKILVPALQKAGYKTPEQERQALQYLFPNRTAGFAMGQLVTQGWKFERDMKLIQGAQGLSAYNTLLKNDPMMAEMALQKQWQNLLVVLGFQIMPALVKGTLLLIDVLRPLGRWLFDHPRIAKALMYSLLGLSAAMAFAGRVLLLKAVFMSLGLAFGLVLPSLTGVASAFGSVGTAIAVGAGGIGLAPLLLGAAAAIAVIAGVAYAIKHPDVGRGGARPQGYVYHPEYGSDTSIAFGGGTGRSNFVPSGATYAPAPPGDVYLDGKKVGVIVTEHQSKEASKAPAHGSGFDWSLGMVPVMSPYAP